MLVVQDAHIRLGREREHRMLHARHVVLEEGQRVEHVADEEIAG